MMIFILFFSIVSILIRYSISNYSETKTIQEGFCLAFKNDFYYVHIESKSKMMIDISSG